MRIDVFVQNGTIIAVEKQYELGETLKVGLQIEPQFGFEYEDVRKIAEKAVNIGISSLWFSDHFMLNKDATDRVLLDPFLLMTALTLENKWIRVGSLVFCNSYRNPALLAKMAATLDVLSDGRLEFGIGAGWKEIEYRAYGYPFPPDMIRIEQLGEALQIIKGAWTEVRFSFIGRHYAVEDLISYPKPVQKPHPTIWVGTMKARPMMLRLAAQHGDGINVAWSFSPQDCKRIFDQLDSFADETGRSKRIKRSVGLWTRIFPNQKEMEQHIRDGAHQRNITIEEYRKRIKSALWGTPETISHKLGEYADLDVDYAILMLPHNEELLQLELLTDCIKDVR